MYWCIKRRISEAVGMIDNSEFLVVLESLLVVFTQEIVI